MLRGTAGGSRKHIYFSPPYLSLNMSADKDICNVNTYNFLRYVPDGIVFLPSPKNHCHLALRPDGYATRTGSARGQRLEVCSPLEPPGCAASSRGETDRATELSESQSSRRLLAEPTSLKESLSQRARLGEAPRAATTYPAFSPRHVRKDTRQAYPEDIMPEGHDAVPGASAPRCSAGRSVYAYISA